MDSLLEDAAGVEPLAVLSRFRVDFHACLTARRDELFELTDAVLCAGGPVKTLAGLSLAPEHRRPAAALPGRAAITARRGWAAGAGGGCEQLAAARGGDQPGPVVLPRL